VLLVSLIYDLSLPPSASFLPLARRRLCWCSQAYDAVKIDVFGTGCMLFMLLKGFPAFATASRADPGFWQAVWKRDPQGLLRKYGMPPLPDEARLSMFFFVLGSMSTAVCRLCEVRAAVVVFALFAPGSLLCVPCTARAEGPGDTG